MGGGAGGYTGVITSSDKVGKHVIMDQTERHQLKDKIGRCDLKVKMERYVIMDQTERHHIKEKIRELCHCGPNRRASPQSENREMCPCEPTRKASPHRDNNDVRPNRKATYHLHACGQLRPGM